MHELGDDDDPRSGLQEGLRVRHVLPGGAGGLLQSDRAAVSGVAGGVGQEPGLAAAPGDRSPGDDEDAVRLQGRQAPGDPAAVDPAGAGSGVGVPEDEHRLATGSGRSLVSGADPAAQHRLVAGSREWRARCGSRFHGRNLAPGSRIAARGPGPAGSRVRARRIGPPVGQEPPRGPALDRPRPQRSRQSRPRGQSRRDHEPVHVPDLLMMRMRVIQGTPNNLQRLIAAAPRAVRRFFQCDYPCGSEKQRTHRRRRSQKRRANSSTS